MCAGGEEIKYVCHTTKKLVFKQVEVEPRCAIVEEKQDSALETTQETGCASGRATEAEQHQAEEEEEEQPVVLVYSNPAE